MTDVVTYRPADPAGQLVAWAAAAESAFQLADALVRTNVCPPAFRGKPAEATAVILLGAELGLTPIAALRSMFEIRGTLGMYVRAQVALAQSRGHRIWTVAESDDAVTVAGHRADDPAHVEEVTWSIARARQAGFIRRGARGEPSQYELQPRTMLWARAAGDVARRIAADVLAGVAELDDPADVQATPASTTSGTIRRQPRPVTEVELPPPPERSDEKFAGEGVSAGQEPEVSDTPDELPRDDEPPNDDGEPLVSPAQRRMLHPLFIEIGVRSSEDRHAWLARFLGHDVESTNDLTVTEASAAIDELQRLRAGRDDG